jgi:hypothetical protein
VAVVFARAAAMCSCCCRAALGSHCLHTALGGGGCGIAWQWERSVVVVFVRHCSHRPHVAWRDVAVVFGRRCVAVVFAWHIVVVIFAQWQVAIILHHPGIFVARPYFSHAITPPSSSCSSRGASWRLQAREGRGRGEMIKKGEKNKQKKTYLAWVSAKWVGACALHNAHVHGTCEA